MPNTPIDIKMPQTIPSADPGWMSINVSNRNAFSANGCARRKMSKKSIPEEIKGHLKQL
jgi:isocitrate dehydrogenase